MWWILDRLKSHLSQLYYSSNYSQTNLLPPCRKVCACRWVATSPRYCCPLVDPQTMMASIVVSSRGIVSNTMWIIWWYTLETGSVFQWLAVSIRHLYPLTAPARPVWAQSASPSSVHPFFLVVPKKSPLHRGLSCQGYCRRHLLCVCVPPVLSSYHRGPVCSSDLIPGSHKTNLARFWRVSCILQCVPRCHILPCRPNLCPCSWLEST